MTIIRAAMVGGGIGGFIGEIHRMAMRLDNRYELVAGALSSAATRAMESATNLTYGGTKHGKNFWRAKRVPSTA